METQRQDREEALITARAELKDLDLEEVDLESKIAAANDEIKLRTTQEEKVKEEMTNLKAGENCPLMRSLLWSLMMVRI